MKIYFQVDSESNSLYIGFVPVDNDRPVARTSELTGGIFGDFDSEGRLLGLDFEDVDATVIEGDLSTFEIDQLVGVKEASELIGIERSNFVRDYANRPGFPSPVVELGSGRIWLRSDIDSYLRRNRPTKATRWQLVNVLQTMRERDEMAFRHVALTHFDRAFLDSASAEPPSLESVALENLEQDWKLASTVREGSLDSFVSAGETLFKKYYSCSKSLLIALLDESFQDKTDNLFREIWATAFREMQISPTDMIAAGNFTRWLLRLIYGTLDSYQIPIDTTMSARLSLSYDPLSETVILQEFQRASSQFVRTRADREARKLIAEYVDSLSLEELSVFYGGRRDKSQIDAARKRMLQQLRKRPRNPRHTLYP
jgi:predicted DNA-binding transcriptional regulator AlpA